MSEDANIFSIIETIKEEAHGKTDISSGDNSIALNTAIDQMTNIFSNRTEVEFSESDQQTLLYLLVKLLDICIKINDETVVYNFEITFLCLQCLQQFRVRYPEIVHLLAHDLSPNYTESQNTINFLEVSVKYLNIQIPQFVMDLFLSIIQEIAELFSVDIYQSIGLDPFIDLLSIFEKLESPTQNKIIIIIKKIIQNIPIDSSFSKYLDRFLNIAVLFYDQLRKNDVTNDLIEIQSKILKKLIIDETNLNDSQDAAHANEDASNVITFDYTNSIFQLLMKLCHPLFNSTDTINSQKAFKFDAEKKLFRKLIIILAILCSNKDGFRYVIGFIQSPPDLEFDPSCSTQYSQSSQNGQFETSFDFAKLLYIFRDRPTVISPLIFRIYRGVIRFCFNSNETDYRNFMKDYVTDENEEENEEENENENETNLIGDEERDIIDTCGFISRSIQPVLLDLAVSPITKDDLFHALRCLSYSLHYIIPHYSKISNMFLFVLQGFALNKQNLTMRSLSGLGNNNQGLFANNIANNNNFNNANAFRINNNFNFGNNFRNNNNNFNIGNNFRNNNAFNNNNNFNFNFGNNFRNNNAFNNNNFNFNFGNNNANINNDNNDNEDNSNSKITYNYTNQSGNILNRHIALRILIPFKNYAPALDSFFLEILKPKKEETKNVAYMNDYNQFKEIVDEFNHQRSEVKYTKTKLKKVTFDQVIDLIVSNQISKVNFLKQGFVNHCITLVNNFQEGKAKFNLDDDQDLMSKVKILIKYCFDLIKIVPIYSINSNSMSKARLMMNGFHNIVDYKYKHLMFHLHHFDSLAMIEGLINLKEQNLNRDLLVAFSQTKPEIKKLIKTNLNDLSWPSQFAIFYRAFDHPQYKKKGIKVNGKVYSHMDSQYRVMAEQGFLRMPTISCSAVNENKKRKTVDSRGYSILTIPEMQVKCIHEYSEILALLTKLHEVFVANKQFITFYKNQNSGMKNNYINYDAENEDEVFEEEEENNNNNGNNEYEEEYGEYNNEEEENNNGNDNENENNENINGEEAINNIDNNNNENNNNNEEEENNDNNNNESENENNNNDDDDESESENDNENDNNKETVILNTNENEGDFDDDDDEEGDDESMNGQTNELVQLFIDKEFTSMIKFITIPSEVISLKSASLSTILNYPFLFPFNTRVTAMKLLVFPCQNSLTLCDREFTQGDQDEDDEVLQFDEHVIHLVVDRPQKDGNSDEFFKQGCEIVKRFAPNPEMFDVEFTGEKGIGKGPTHEFYTLLSRCFCEAKRKIFKNNSSALEAEAAHEADQEESESQLIENDLEIDIDLDSRPQSTTIETESSSSSSLSISDQKDNSSSINDNVQYCVDKLGMFPSYEADPSIYEILGIFCAKAIFMECIVDIYFNPAFFKLCRNKKINLSEVDPQLAISFSNKEGLIGCNFAYMDRELIENGADVDITEENVDKFLFLVEDLLIGSGIKNCVDNFLKGFCQILPFDVLNMFSESEISQLLGGSKSVEITNDDFTNNIKYEGGYTNNSRAILLLKDLIMNDMSDYDRQRLIQFITGFNRLPIGGISALKPKFTISRYLPADFHLTKSSTKAERAEMQRKIDMMLPTVSTCTNKLRLPSYSNKDIMYQKLDYCMSESGGFQLI